MNGTCEEAAEERRVNRAKEGPWRRQDPVPCPEWAGNVSVPGRPWPARHSLAERRAAGRLRDTAGRGLSAKGDDRPLV